METDWLCGMHFTFAFIPISHLTCSLLLIISKFVSGNLNMTDIFRYNEIVSIIYLKYGFISGNIYQPSAISRLPVLWLSPQLFIPTCLSGLTLRSSFSLFPLNHE